MNKKYNSKLFLVGLLMNLISKFPLLLIAVVLALIGIKNQACLYIAFGIFILAMVWSFIQQIQIKYTVEHSENPDFKPFAKAMMSDNWKEEIKDIVEKKKQGSDGNNIEE